MSPVSSGKSKSGEHRTWHRHPATVRREIRFGATPGSGFRAGLRNRQSLGRPIPAGENMLARYGPITLRSYVGSDTACALLYARLQREDAAMMETALDRPAADSTLPPEVRRCRGHAPTREAPDARRAGRCRQRLPEVRNGVERAWKGLFADADAWFRSSAADRPLDFESICQALGLAPSFIRVGLHRWCSARRREPRQSRTVLRFPFRRMSGTRHMISAVS